MALHIADVLDQQTLAAVRERLAEDAPFTDGRDTAAGLARDVKDNQQLAVSSASKAVERLIEQRLRTHPVFAAAARPRDFARVQVNRYRAGMSYGMHVDAALVDGRRTDLSFTCFLSEPGDYDGGELVIEQAGGEQSVKLPAGDCYLYPAGSLHRVNEVTRGERLAAVGWIRSLVRDNECRMLLFELDRTIESLGSDTAPVALSLSQLRNALLRRWVD